MRVRKWLHFSIIPATLAAAGVALATSGDPPAQRTGAPAIGGKSAESSCFNCHNGNPLNGGAALELVNAPNFYVAGQTYTFTVRISSTQTSGNANRAWSFELTAVNQADGNGAGTLATVAGQETTIKNGTGNYSTRRYIMSNTDRIGAGTPVSWQVQWTAPNPSVGTVGFYAAGIAANGTGGTSGDYVATASQVTQDVTPVESASWGRVKSLFR